ncbi:MAG: hypothetical protein AAFR61_26925 [Bacteroidota bacterium]
MNLPKLLLLLIPSLFFFQLTLAQSPDSTGLYPFQSTEGGFEGPGLDWVLDQAQGRQFVMFGEQHGVEGVARLVDVVYQALASRGYRHLVLETDSWTTSQLNQGGLEAFLQANPFSIAFDYDEDLALTETALAEADSVPSTLWGVDQSFIAIHPYDRLRELAHTGPARRLAKGAFLKATLRMGRYIREEHRADLIPLKAVFADCPDPEAAEILEELEASMEIYTLWQRGDKSQSSAVREQFMKDKLDAYVAADSGLAQAVFKMGGAHITYGIGPNGVLTLGDHARELARKNGRKSLAIGLRRFNAERALPDSSDFQGKNLLLLDTKAWLAAHEADSLALTESQKRGLAGYDAIIYFKGAGNATKNRVASYEKAFRSRTIWTLVPFGVLAVLGLSFLFPGIVALFRKKQQGKSAKLILASSCLALVGLILYQILGFLQFPAWGVGILPASTSIFIFLPFFLLGLVNLTLLFRSWGQAWWSTGFRIYYSLLVLAFLGLTTLAYSWNLGGMLG